jgi:hypothetical protein
VVVNFYVAALLCGPKLLSLAKRHGEHKLLALEYAAYAAMLFVTPLLLGAVLGSVGAAPLFSESNASVLENTFFSSSAGFW